MEKEQKIELAKEILGLAGITTLFVAAVIAPPAVAAFGKLYLDYKKYDNSNKWQYRAKAKRTIKNLENQGLLVVESKGEQMIVKITQSGKRWLKRKEILNIKINRPKHWDSIWRVIVFDIPEESANKRKIFRSWLKRLGFARLQKSVWVIPWPCKGQFEALAAELKLGNEAIILETKVIAKEKTLKRIFEL